MRKRFLFCFFILSCTINVHAQQSTNDSLRAKIDTLEKKLEEDNYTRIPKQDFDNLLTEKVNEQVSEELQGIIKWISIITGLIAVILSFLAKYYFNDIIRKELASTSQKLEDNIKTSIDKRLVDTVSVIWEDGASNLIRKAKELNYQDESIINSISHFLETENLKLDEEVKLNLIAALVKCYFYSQKKDKIERLIQIISKYENEKIKLRPETYADAAIVFCDNYEFYGTENYLTATIDYCNKSISTLPDYGTPYAVKFEAFMISYKKAYDNTDTAAALENVRKLFKAIANNKSDVVCAETIVRFFGDKKVYLKEYLEELEKQFPQDIKDMKQRAFNYLTKNPQDLANPNTTDLFESLKVEGFVAV
jgi:hypothetical protein